MGEIGVFTRATSPDEDKTVFGNIMAAVMRGNAMVQGQAQAKKVATDQMTTPAPVITLKPHPDGVSPPLVTVKDISADMLNQTQQSDVIQAHDTPHINVENKIKQLGIGDFEKEALREVGVTPKATENTAENLKTYGQDYRFQRGMGEGVFSAAVKGGLMRAGLFNKGRAAEDLNTMNAAKNAAYFKQDVAPIIGAKTELMNAGNEAQRLAGEQARAAREAIKFTDDKLNDVVKNINYGTVSFQRWRDETEAAAGRKLTDAEWAKVQDKGNRDVNTNLDEFLGKKNPAARAALGSYESFDQLQQAYGGDIPPRRLREVNQEWKTARDAYQLADTRKREEIDALRMRTEAERNKLAPPAEIKPNTPQFKVAQDLAYGKLTMQQFRSLYSYSRDSNAKLAIYQKATDLNPNFDPAKFELGYKFAASPKIRQQVASADNAIALIPEAIEISDKATRLGSTALNKLILKGGVALGGKKYTDFATLQTAFADEISGALGFGSATDMTRELGLKMTDLSLSAPNFRSAMQIVGDFLQKKRGALVNQMGVYGKDVDQFSNQQEEAPNLPVIEFEHAPDGSLRVKKKSRMRP